MSFPVKTIRQGERLVVIEQAMPVDAVPADISAVNGLPIMTLRLANADRTGPRAGAVAHALTVSFAAAASGLPAQWTFTLPPASVVPAGIYALTSSYPLLGGAAIIPPHSIIRVEAA